MRDRLLRISRPPAGTGPPDQRHSKVARGLWERALKTHNDAEPMMAAFELDLRCRGYKLGDSAVKEREHLYM